MKVLVTGGAGFIGSHTVDLLLDRGHTVTVLDDLSTGVLANIPPGARLFRERVHDPDSISEWYKFDTIIHLAAQPSLRRSLDDPAHDATVNIVGTLNVIQAAKQCGAHLVFASTSAVYPPGWARPNHEDHPLAPNVPYGIAKMAAERYLHTSDVSHTILRYGNVYGPRQVQVGENQLIPHCLAHILDGKPFAIHGDGAQTRDLVFVGDIARANVLAAEQRVRGIFNAGTGRGVSVNSVCERLAWICDWRGTFAHDDAKAGDARHVALDSARAAERLGWRAETLLDDGLKATVGAWKERG